MNLTVLFYFLLQLFGEFWPVALLIAIVVAAYVYGGSRLAMIAGATITALLVYLRGRRDEKQALEKAAKEIRQKREKAYEKIDDRRTGVDDVARRLRDRTF